MKRILAAIIVACLLAPTIAEARASLWSQHRAHHRAAFWRQSYKNHFHHRPVWHHH